MSLNLTDEEREFLLELLEARHKSMLHELHHTDTHDYKEMLEQKIAMLEGLKEKLKKG
jgi:hypothetical protein